MPACRTQDCSNQNDGNETGWMNPSYATGDKPGSGGTLLDRGTKALIVGPAWVGGHMQFKRVARVPLERCVKGWVELRRRPAVPDPFTLAATRRDRCQDANSLTF